MKTQSPLPLVLVVDDEAGIRSMEMRILEAGGYAVREAAGASEAFAMLEGGIAPDLMIADLDMPELSGEQMVQRIHQARPHQKVLYVTGNIDRLLDARPLILDGEAFLDKPFTATACSKRSRSLLTQRIGHEAAPKKRKWL